MYPAATSFSSPRGELLLEPAAVPLALLLPLRSPKKCAPIAARALPPAIRALDVPVAGAEAGMGGGEGAGSIKGTSRRRKEKLVVPVSKIDVSGKEENALTVRRQCRSDEQRLWSMPGYLIPRSAV